jgi:hypothetical protein
MMEVVMEVLLKKKRKDFNIENHMILFDNIHGLSTVSLVLHEEYK